MTTQAFQDEAQAALSQLQSLYGTAELDRRDAVILMQGWNKILAFSSSWKEACWFRWRILEARQELRTVRGLTPSEATSQARHVVESNKDPIAQCLGERCADAKDMILALFDEQIRSLCPHRQTVQRESYRNVTADRGASFGMNLECDNAADIFRLLAKCGVRPHHWMTLCEAFHWTMSTHSPYADETEVDELRMPIRESVFCRFCALKVARLGIQDSLDFRQECRSSSYKALLPFWQWVQKDDATFRKQFFSELYSSYPELLDYFTHDTVAERMTQIVDILVRYPCMAGEYDSSFRCETRRLGEMHRVQGVPTEAYPMMGTALIQTLRDWMIRYAENSKDTSDMVTAEELEMCIVDAFRDTVAFLSYPMYRQEQLIQDAVEFFETVAEELDWSSVQLSKRLVQVHVAIATTGTYEHTFEELELGARLAWRNSAKCIGRIAWNTLQVRDCRHVTTPEEVIHEIQEHLEMATAGTSLKSVMTVFRPKQPNEAWGTKFWSTQVVRYACYVDEEGNTMGDTANLDFTRFLIERGLWTPPETRTQHDVLPIVFKMPGRDKPVVHQLDPKYIHEASIEHPTCPDVAKLGHKWTSIPCISDFNMNLGGIDYGCMPFNGWFVSTEVVRNLMERYPGCSENWAAAMDIDVTSLKMWKTRIAHEIDVAVLHSFEKAGYTIVDPDTVGEQFMTHCKRESDAGRECPAQWSWIGGLTGFTNKTWHMEMRDFRLKPTYDYCCKMYQVTGEDEIFPVSEEEPGLQPNSRAEEADDESYTIPRVLITYGSETGTAQAAAGRLKRALRLAKPLVLPMNRVAGLEIIKQQNITHLLVLCSTFGEGQPPTTAVDFFTTAIPRETLKGTKVSVLAFGSSVYPNFCAAGKTAHKLLAQAGGTELAPLAMADETLDSPGSVAQWIKEVKDLILPPYLEEEIQARTSLTNESFKYQISWETKSSTSAEVNRFEWPKDQSSLCRINEELIIGGDITKRSTRRVVFDVPPGCNYVTGDHLTISPLNSMEMVLRFTRCFAKEIMNFAESQNVKKPSLDELLHWQLQQSPRVELLDNGQVYPVPVNFDTTSTLSDVLQAQVGFELNETLVSDFITVLGGYIPMDMEGSRGETVQRFRQLSTLIHCGTRMDSQRGMDSFLSRYPTVVDLLEAFHPILDDMKCPVPMADVLAILPRLQPRVYSISSSSAVTPNIVEVTVGVLHRYTEDNVHIEGVCSNYLARLQQNVDRVKISIHTSSFREPRDVVNTPMILVGAGTGLSPMMGFLENRAHALLVNKMVEEKKCDDTEDTNNCHLIFGCRSSDEHLYRDKICDWQANGVLNLHLALSRSPDHPKTYVQNLIRQESKSIVPLLLREDCTYYVCGNADVAEYCFEALVDALQAHGDMSRAQASQWLMKMRVEDRYQFDLFRPAIRTVQKENQERRRGSCFF